MGRRHRLFCYPVTSHCLVSVCNSTHLYKPLSMCDAVVAVLVFVLPGTASATADAYFSRPATPAVSPPSLGSAMAINASHIVIVGSSSFSSLEIASERWDDRERSTSGTVLPRSSFAADGVRYVFASGDAEDGISTKVLPISAFDTKTGAWTRVAIGAARADDPNLGSRYGHASVVLRDCERKTDASGARLPHRCLVVFGGGWLGYANGVWTPAATLKSDTRVARLGIDADAAKDLAQAIPAATTNVSLNSMYAWEIPTSTIDSGPPPRIEAAATTSADSSGMVIFGGFGGSNLLAEAVVRDDLWLLESRPSQGIVELVHDKNGGAAVSVSSSGQAYGGSGAYAIDGNYNTQHQRCVNGQCQHYCSHSSNTDEPWLRFDLGGRRPNIVEIKLWLREDACCTERARGVTVIVSSETTYSDAKTAGNHFECGQELSAHQTRPTLKCPPETVGRYVYVSNVKNQWLSVCEAQVFQQQLWRWLQVPDVENAALGAATWSNRPAYFQGAPVNLLRDGRFAVDGLDDSSNNVNPCSELTWGNDPMLAIDLGRRRDVKALRVVERNDCCGDRMDGMELYIGDSKTDHTKNVKCTGVPNTFNGAVTVSCEVQGRYAQVRVPGTGKILQVCEVEVMVKKDAWPMPRRRASMTTFRGTALVFGGIGADQIVHNDVNALDLNSKSWLTGTDALQTLGSTPAARSLAHVIPVGKSTVWLLGGTLGDGTASRDVWKLGFSKCDALFDPADRIDAAKTRDIAGLTYVSCKPGSELAVSAERGGDTLLCSLDGRVVGVQPACRGAVPGAPPKPSAAGIAGTVGAVNVSFQEPASVGAGAIVKYRVQATLPPYVYSFAGKTKADVSGVWSFKPGSDGASTGNDYFISDDGKLVLSSTAARDCWGGRGQCPVLVHPWPEGHLYATRGGTIVAETHVRLIATGEFKAAGMGIWWDDGRNDGTRSSGETNRLDVMFLIAASGGDNINIRVDRMDANRQFNRFFFGTTPLPTREATLQIRLKGNLYEFYYKQTGSTDFIKCAEFSWSSSYHANLIRTSTANGIPMSFGLLQKSWATGGGQLVEFDYFRTTSLDCGLTPGVEREVAPRAMGSAAVNGFAELFALAPGQDYQFRVAAANLDGYGPWSPSSDASKPTAAAAPTIRRLTSPGMRGGMKCISGGRGYAFATDGRTGQRWSDVACTHSCQTRGSWLYLDFERRVVVTSVRLWMRSEFRQRNSYSRIRVGDSIANDMMDQSPCANVGINFIGPATFNCPDGLQGRYVSIAVPEWANQPLQVCEMEVNGYFLDSCPDRSSTTTYEDGDPVVVAPCRGDTVGSECELVCNTQARSVELMGGRTKATCDASGRWTAEPPLCEQTCSPLALPAGVRSCRQRLVSADFSTPRHLAQFESTEPLVHDRDGTWRVEDGLLHAVTAGGAACADNGVALKTLVSGVDALSGSVRIVASVRTSNTAGVIFRAVDNRNFMRFILDLGAQEFRLERVLSGSGKVLSSAKFPVPLEASRFHHIEVGTTGDAVSVRVDSVLFVRAKESLLSGGSAGVVSYSAAQFDSFSIESGCDETGCVKAVQGGVCSMSCRPGWDQIGNATRTCQADGVDWDNGGNTPFKCKIRPPAVGNYRLSIPENSARNVPVGEPIQGLLEDDLEQLAYKIETGADGASVFAIDLCSGQIKVADSFALDYEVRQRFDIQVRVYVADYPDAFTLSNVTIRILDVNEPPMLPTRRMTVTEHPASGVVLGFVNATDPEGDALVYKVEIDETGGALQVNETGAAGRVSTTSHAAETLDYEARALYTLIVSVTEQDTPDAFSATGTVEVTVLDANDPPVIARDQILTLDETAATVGADFLPSVTTSDQDTGAFASDTVVSLVPPLGLTGYSDQAAAAAALGLVAGQSDSAGVALRVYPPTTDAANTATSQLLLGMSPNTSTVQLLRLPGRVSGGAYGKELGQAFFLKDIASREAYAVLVRASDSHGGIDEAWLPVIIRANQTTDPVVESMSSNAAAMKTEGGETVVFTGKNFGSGTLAGWYERRDAMGRVTRTYNASCMISSTVELRCTTAPGVGAGLSWHLYRTTGPAVVRVRSLAPLLGAYGSPTVVNVTGSVGLPTAGGAELVLYGSNFGPSFAPVSLTYGPAGASSSCVDTGIRAVDGSHTRVVCRTTQGGGSNLEWSVSVGGQTVSRSELAASTGASGLPMFSHAPPRVSKVVMASTGSPATGLDTAGGQQLRITGTNFGPAWVTEASAQLQVRFVGPSGTDLPLTACSKPAGAATHTTIVCSSASWVGAAHPVSVEVAGVRSAVNASNTEALVFYAAPVLSSVTGPGARGGNTQGGQEIMLRGMHMGPDASQIQAVRYGPANGAAQGRFSYLAQSCAVVSVAPSVVRCLSDAGSGRNHSWQIVVASQSSAVLHAATFYGPPVISQFTGSGSAAADTRGGQTIVLSGVNFGPLTVNAQGLLEASYRAVLAGGPAPEARFLPASCLVTQPHEQITCQTAEGAGSDLEWRLVVDGLVSATPTTSYARPTIATVTLAATNAAVTGADVDGGEAVYVDGDSFGPPNFIFDTNTSGPMVQSITYGATGTEYSPLSFKVLGHDRIEAVLAPGSGSGLRFLVRVADQESPRSEATISFARPELVSVKLATGSAAGAVLSTYYEEIERPQLALEVKNLPLRDPLTDIFVVVGNNEAAFSIFPRKPAASDACIPATRVCTLNVMMPRTGLGKHLAVRVGTARAGGAEAAAASLISQPDAQTTVGVDGVSDIRFTGMPATDTTLSYADPEIAYLAAKVADHLAAGGAVGPCPFTSGDAVWQCDDNAMVQVAIIGQNFGAAPADAERPDGVQRHVEMKVSLSTGGALYLEDDAVFVKSWSHNRIVVLTRMRAATLRVRLVSKRWDGVTDTQSVEASYTEMAPQIAALQGADSPFPTIGGGDQSPILLVVTELTDPNVRVNIGGKLANITLRNGDGTFSAIGDNANGEVSALINANIVTNPNTATTPNTYDLYAIVPPGQGVNVPVTVERANAPSDIVTIDYMAPSLSGVQIVRGRGSPSSSAADATAAATVISIPTAGGSTLRLTGQNFGTCPTVVVADGHSFSCSAQSGSRVVECVGTEGTHSCLEIVTPPGEGAAEPGLQDNPYTMWTQHGPGGSPTPQRPKVAFLEPTAVSVSAPSLPTRGGVRISVTGMDFGIGRAGLNDTSAGLLVEIGQPGPSPVAWQVCANPVRLSHSLITCVLPVGGGRGLGVRLTVAGQTKVVAALLSYDRPVIRAVSVAVPASPTGEFGDGGLAPTRVETAEAAALTPFKVRGPVAGGFTMTLTGLNFGNNADTTCVRLAWKSRSAQAVLTCNGVEDSLGEGEVAPARLLSVDHERIELVVPPGMGRKDVIVDVHGQASDETIAPELHHDSPIIARGPFPASGRTDGGSEVRLYGSNFGTEPQNETRDGTPYELHSFAVGTRSPMQAIPNTHFVRVRFHTACITDALTAGGARPRVSDLDNCFPIAPEFRAVRMTLHSDDEIRFMIPPGIGVNRSVTVEVIDSATGEIAASSPAYFSYQRPEITGANPLVVRFEDELGGSRLVDILGNNFGNAERAVIDQWTADELRLDAAIGGVPCSQKRRRREQGGTILSCTLDPGVPVGPQNVSIHIAGQPGFMDAVPESSALKIVCERDFFGQPGDVCMACPVGAKCFGYNCFEHVCRNACSGCFNGTRRLAGPEIDAICSDRWACPSECGLQTCLGRATPSEPCIARVCDHSQPRPLPGFFNLNTTDRFNSDMISECPPNSIISGRDVCIVPCSPLEACLGDNLCAPGYRSTPPHFRCSSCELGFYRRAASCVRCPDSPELLIVAFVALAVGAAGVGYLLNQKGIDVALIQIGVDYMQVLAIFASARIAWPPFIQDVFHVMSAFNLNLEITAPECLVPDIAFVTKWLLMMAIPVGCCVFLLMAFAGGFAWRFFVKRLSVAVSLQVGDKILAGFVILLYFLYLQITKQILDIFNCVPTTPPDGRLYLQAVFEPCDEPGGVRETLIVPAIIALAVYSIGYPLFAAVVVRSNIKLIMMDQLLRCYGFGHHAKKFTTPNGPEERAWRFRRAYNRLFYAFKPDFYMWILVLLTWKFLIAIAALMFADAPDFQMAFVLFVLFVNYTLQVYFSPYMSRNRYKPVAKAFLKRADEELTALKMAGKTRSVLSADPLKDRPLRVQVADDFKRVCHENSNTLGIAAGFTSDSASASVVQAAEVRDEDVMGVLRSGFFDYNVVATTLMASATLVTLGGIMFESGRLNLEGAEASRDAITYVVLIIIFASLAYFTVVFGFEMFYACNQEGFVRRAKLRAQTGMGGSRTVEDQERLEREGVGVKTVMSNPMLKRASGSAAADSAEKGLLSRDAAEPAASSSQAPAMLKLLSDLPDDPPTREAWQAIKQSLELTAADVVKLAATNQDLRRMSRTTLSPMTASAGGPMSKSNRRSFAAGKTGSTSRSKRGTKFKAVAASVEAPAAKPGHSSEPFIKQAGADTSHT